jgi:L-tartrate/succinate antiporter
MKYARCIIPVLVMALFWILPVPEGLTSDAMRYLGVFLAVVLGLVLEPLPGAVVGLLGVCMAAALMLVPAAGGKPATLQSSVRWALAGFSNSTVWLMFVAFMFAMGYEKTGLGRRIALYLLKWLGKTALGVGYAVSLADFLLAPFIPSSTARGGGTIFPIVCNIPPAYGSFPDKEPRKIGAYLMWTGVCATSITSSLFLTGLAPNLLALSIARDAVQVTITWREWFMAMLPAGGILVAVTPLVTYIFYPPTEKKFPAIPAWAGEELEKMGPISARELTMTALALFALGMWVFGTKIIDSTLVSLVVLALMLIFRVITWEQAIGNKQAWNTLCWFGTLVTLAGGLAQTGFLKWFSTLCTSFMTGLPSMGVAFGLLALLYFSHYFFAGVTAHAAAMMSLLFTAGLAIPDINIKYLVMFLSGSLGIMGILTPYGAAQNIIYYGAGYIKAPTFWLLGFCYGLFFFAVYTLFAMLWMPTVIG